MAAAGASDDLHDTVDYARAFDLVKEEVEGQSRDLIECVSARIAAVGAQAHHPERKVILFCFLPCFFHEKNVCCGNGVASPTHKLRAQGLWPRSS
jgi:hypothetical protein